MVTRETPALIITVYLAMLSVVKNLTTSFYKVAERELEDKLAKKPKRRQEDVLDKVPLAKGEGHTPNSS